MSGRHRRPTSMIRATTVMIVIMAVALFLSLGAVWIYMDIR